MKKFFIGLIIGLILATTTFAFAESPIIKLIVNGKEIQCDVPPQIVDGRTMVPARFLAEALGAKVEWDAANNAVIVTGGVYAGATPTDLPPTSTSGAIDEPSSPPEQNKPTPIELGYIGGRDLLNILINKYPNSEISISGDNVLYFDEQEFNLVPIVNDNNKFFTIESIVKTGLLVENDIKTQ